MYGLGLRFQTQWLHCTMQNMFTLRRLRPYSLFLCRAGILSLSPYPISSPAMSMSHHRLACNMSGKLEINIAAVNLKKSLIKNIQNVGDFGFEEYVVLSFSNIFQCLGFYIQGS